MSQRLPLKLVVGVVAATAFLPVSAFAHHEENVPFHNGMFSVDALGVLAIVAVAAAIAYSKFRR